MVRSLWQHPTLRQVAGQHDGGMDMCGMMPEVPQIAELLGRLFLRNPQGCSPPALLFAHLFPQNPDLLLDLAPEH